MTQGTVRVQRNFLALAANEFEVRDEFLEDRVAVRQATADCRENMNSYHVNAFGFLWLQTAQASVTAPRARSRLDRAGSRRSVTSGSPPLLRYCPLRRTNRTVIEGFERRAVERLNVSPRSS